MVLDTDACLAAGDCLVITQNQYFLFIGIFVAAAIFLLLVIMISFFTPAMIFLKAKFSKGSLIYIINRGQIGRFSIAKNKFEGIADVKGVGPFIISENSHTVEGKSKMPLYFAFGEFASTLPLDYVQVTNYLRDTEPNINNIEDIADIVGLKFDENTKKWEKIPEDELTEEQKGRYRELKVAIKPYKTIKIHDLANMFPFNITPALVESKIQHMIGLKQAMLNKMTPQLVMMFIMILMGATLAAVIAFKFLQQDPSAGVETRTVIERVVLATPLGNLSG